MRTHGWKTYRHERGRQRGALGLAGVASLAAAILASGCGGRQRDDGRRAERRVERALDWLDVEGEARDRAREAALGLVREAAGLRDDGLRMSGELLAAWRRDTPDAAALRAAVDREIDGMRSRAHRALDDVLALHAALDSEQRAEVADRLTWHERGHRHWSRW
ncbi:MAG: hypothetical protein FJ148_18515 [Deltaproteobacteria bacterium]|nr:hypothetical protein [Deltaproteobacteria bacterium]